MKKKTKCTLLLVIGIILGLGPLWGILGTLVGMVMAFGHMGESGMTNPEALASDIGISLYTTAAGYIMCPLGVACIIISIMLQKRQENEMQNLSQELQPPPVPPDFSDNEPVA